MAYPKMKPCPNCGNEDVVAYAYESGWKHVECDECHYLGPGEGRTRDAIKAHNERCAERAAASLPAPAKAEG